MNTPSVSEETKKERFKEVVERFCSGMEKLTPGGIQLRVCDRQFMEHAFRSASGQSPAHEGRVSNQETGKVDWLGLATYLAQSLSTADSELEPIARIYDRERGEDERNPITDVQHHIEGTIIGCSTDFGVWPTKDGWTTDPIPGLEDATRPKVSLSESSESSNVVSVVAAGQSHREASTEQEGL